MSKKKVQPESPQKALTSAARKFALLVLVVAAFGGAWYLGKMHGEQRVDRFAQCLTDKGTRMYGLFWCPHCEEQKKAFGASFRNIHYIECGTQDHKEQPQCIQDHVINFPTWQFENGERYEGDLPLADLGAKTGCSLQ